MDIAPDHGPNAANRDRIIRLLAIAWVAGLALTYLLRYGAWLFPLQLAEHTVAAVPHLGIGPHLAGFAFGRLADFACVAGILAGAFGLGAVATQRLVPRRNLLAALFALGVGLWAVAALVFLTGAFSMQFVPWTHAGLLCWLLPSARRFFRRANRPATRWDGWSRFMLVCVVAAALLNLLGTIAPPFEYDELEYHLGAPAEYLRAGHITFLPHNFYSNLPQLTEMLYLLAMTTTSEIAAKLLHWSFGVLSALAIYAVAAHLWNRRVALTATAIFYCLPFIQDVSQTARIDLATTFFAVLAFGGLLVDEWRLGGLAAGGALATKWTAASVVLFPCVVYLATRTRSLRRPAVFCLLAAVPIVPWLLKNWLLAGNPVYPLLTGLWPSPHWGPEQAAMFAEKHFPAFGWYSLWEFIERTWHYSMTEPRAVPLLLMLAPLILLVRRPDPAAKRAAWLFAAAYAGWFLLTFRPWRFLLPAFPLAAMTGAYALESLRGDRLVRSALGVVLAVCLAMLALNILMDVEDPERLPPKISFAQHALGQTSREESVSRLGQGCLEPVIWMNENLPAKAKVLYVGEARVYYARHPVLWSTAFDRHPLMEMRAAGTPVELLATMRARGITHVYINFSELERLRSHYHHLLDANWYVFRNFLQQHAREVHHSGRGVVYELAG